MSVSAVVPAASVVAAYHGYKRRRAARIERQHLELIQKEMQAVHRFRTNTIIGQILCLFLIVPRYPITEQEARSRLKREDGNYWFNRWDEIEWAGKSQEERLRELANTANFTGFDMTLLDSDLFIVTRALQDNEQEEAEASLRGCRARFGNQSKEDA